MRGRKRIHLAACDFILKFRASVEPSVHQVAHVLLLKQAVVRQQRAFAAREGACRTDLLSKAPFMDRMSAMTADAAESFLDDEEDKPDVWTEYDEANPDR